MQRPKLATATEENTEPVQPVLRAKLAIEPDPSSNCAILREGSNARSITHQIKSGTHSTQEESRHVIGRAECHTELSFEGENSTRQYLKSAVTGNCICPVFRQHDCIPKITGINANAIIVIVIVPSRSALRDVISDLREVNASVSVEWLVNGGGDSATAEIDVSTITTKQRDALETALELGYYDTPRKTDLSELATQLDISESAASQRLNAAETKLVKSFLDADTTQQNTARNE